jgi:hypothetical protein
LLAAIFIAMVSFMPQPRSTPKSDWCPGSGKRGIDLVDRHQIAARRAAIGADPSPDFLDCGRGENFPDLDGGLVHGESLWISCMSRVLQSRFFISVPP